MYKQLFSGVLLSSLVFVIIKFILEDPDSLRPTFVDSTELVVSVLFIFSFLLPIIIFGFVLFAAGVFLFRMRLYYWRLKKYLEIDYVLLKISLPETTETTVKSMELIMNQIHINSGEGNSYDKYVLFKTRPTFSFEIVSNEGNVEFYIRFSAHLRTLVSSAIYGFYPDAQIVETEDYAENFYFRDEIGIWGCEFALTKEDFFPILTYKHFELDDSTDEPDTVDPLNSFIETISSLGNGQRVWLQIISRSNKYKRRKSNNIFSFDFYKEKSWADEGNNAVSDIYDSVASQKRGLEDDDEDGKNLTLTPGEKNLITDIQRTTNQNSYEVGIRAIYMSDNPEDSDPSIILGLTSAYKSFGTGDYNSFKPTGGHTVFSYPWQETKSALKKTKDYLFNNYRMRLYFLPPPAFDTSKKPFLLSVEELASIFHFPTSATKTPSLDRVRSKEGGPPANLPV